MPVNQELLDSLRKLHKGKVLSGGEIVEPERILTGVATVDVALGGGIPLGRAIELYGLQSTGKSTLSLRICKAEIDAGYTPVYIDIESTVTPSQLELAGINPDEIIVTRPTHGEEAIDIALDSLEMGSRIIILDSLAMLVPETVSDKLENDSGYMSIGATARMLSALQTKIVSHLHTHSGTIIGINQVRDKVNSPHGGKDTPGGRAWKFISSLRIDLMYSKKDDKIPGRVTTHFNVEKNKTHRAYLSGSFVIDGGRIDLSEALVQEAIAQGVIYLSGSWYKFKDEWKEQYGENIGQGMNKATQVLSSNPELFSKLYMAVLEKAEIDTSKIVNL